MYYEPYEAGQLHLAYCHRVHFRFQTHCRLPQPYLEALRQDEFQASLAPYGIRLLDVASDEVDLLCQVSLRPEECVAACASKFKGRLSKWLRTAQGLDAPAKLLAIGYLACTVGDPTRKDIEGYIGRQGEHHGYSERPLPPVFVEEYPLPAVAAVRLDAAHNVSLLRYHLVFGTMYRRGVFTQTEAAGVVAAWQSLQAAEQFALLKVSFVPDHVHAAVRVHPSVAPLALAVKLMNLAQEVMFERFPEVVIRYSANRLWENGAYVGSFGELSSRAVRAAIEEWRGYCRA
jgi:REP element-mobilizing transposase RayT